MPLFSSCFWDNYNFFWHLLLVWFLLGQFWCLVLTSCFYFWLELVNWWWKELYFHLWILSPHHLLPVLLEKSSDEFICVLWGTPHREGHFWCFFKETALCVSAVCAGYGLSALPFLWSIPQCMCFTTKRKLFSTKFLLVGRQINWTHFYFLWTAACKRTFSYRIQILYCRKLAS